LTIFFHKDIIVLHWSNLNCLKQKAFSSSVQIDLDFNVKVFQSYIYILHVYLDQKVTVYGKKVQ